MSIVDSQQLFMQIVKVSCISAIRAPIICGYGKTKLSRTRDAGSADPENYLARPQTWMGHRETHPADIQRDSAGAAGITLSGALSPGAAGLDQSQMGGERKRTPNQVLFTDSGRAEAVEARNGKLETTFRSSKSGH